MKFRIFFYFCGSFFCPPGSGFQIRIQIHWPDWIQIQYRSGSATLDFFRHAVGTREGDSGILLRTESFNQLYRKSKGRTSCLHRINIRGKLRASNMALHHCRSRLVHRNWRKPAVLWKGAQNSLLPYLFPKNFNFKSRQHTYFFSSLLSKMDHRRSGNDIINFVQI
jgi:hypothetical protein